VEGRAASAPPRLEPWGAEELAATLDSVGTGIWALDLEGRCVFINQAACRVLGYAREECLGAKIQCEIHGNHCDGWVCPKEDCRVQQALQSGSAVQVDDEVFRRRDGTSIAVKYSIQPVVVDGRMRGSVISMTDIAARKRAEEAQRKSDEWLSFAQNAAGVGIFDLDVEAGQVRVSEGQFRLYGLDPAGPWPKQEAWRQLVHPDDRERMDRQLELELSGVQPSGVEYRVVWPDGSVHWLFSQRTVFFDEEGRPRRVVGANVDITGRVRAEMALDHFFSASPTPMAIGDFEGRVRRVNPAWEPMLEIAAGEAEGTLLFNWIHPEDRAAVAAEYATLLDTGERLGFECRIRRKDGSYRWVLLDAGAQREARVVYVTAHDITDRQRAEEALRESEARFRSAFENTLFGMAFTALDGRFLQVNQSLCRITGFAERELLQTDFAAITCPDDVPENLELRRKLMEGGAGGGILTKRYMRKDGETAWARIHVALVRDAQAKPLYFTALVEDITERKRAATYRDLSSEVLRILNEQGFLRDSIERVLAAVKARTGFDAVGIRLEGGDDFPYFAQDGFPPDFLLTENTLTERGADGGPCRDGDGNLSLECTCGLVLSGRTDASNPLFTPGGSCWTNDSRQILDLPPDLDPRLHPRNRCVHEGYGSVALVPIRAKDRIVGLLQLNDRRKGCFSLAAIEQMEGIAAHVGGTLMRKRAEEALRESEEKFRELFDYAPVAYHELDLGGVVRRVNRAECALLGYQPGEMLGRPIWDFIAGTEREGSHGVYRRKLAGEQPLEPHQRLYVRRDGGEMWIEIHDSLVRNAAGEVTGIRSALLDITERKRLLEAVKRHAERLARSNAELERFAYVASHDLQEPLRMVASFTRLLSQRYSGRLDETADRYIDYAVDGAKHMQQLIVDLLEYSRLNSKELDIQHTECDAVVADATRNLHAAIQESGGSVDWDPLPALWVDRGQLTELFQNLLGNAIKFRRKDECPRIHVSAVDGGPHWVLSVQDNGIGIDPRHRERVFQVFHRLHARAEYSGTGIGLAVCRKVAERHGGKIWVESKPGAGSTFHFTIPKTPMDPETPGDRSDR